MSTLETFHGYIETTADTLLIFEACRRGLFKRINRRLQERERSAVRSGTVFVFDEKESGIKRWTDGLVWSPSRILGNFLIYRELDNRESSHGKRGVADRRHSSYASCGRYDNDLDQDNSIATWDRNRERAIVGSLTNSYKFKKGGLIKKTMSIVVNGSPQHLISYYTREDVLSSLLPTPSSIPELACLTIAPELWVRQSFRAPPALTAPHESDRSSLSPATSATSINSLPERSSRRRASPRRRTSDVSDGLILKVSRTSLDSVPMNRSSVVSSFTSDAQSHAYHSTTPEFHGAGQVTASRPPDAYDLRFHRVHSLSSSGNPAATAYSISMPSSMMMQNSYMSSSYPQSSLPTSAPLHHTQTPSSYPPVVQHPIHSSHHPKPDMAVHQQQQSRSHIPAGHHQSLGSAQVPHPPPSVYDEQDKQIERLSPMESPPVNGYMPQAYPGARKGPLTDGSSLPSPSSGSCYWQQTQSPSQSKTPSAPFHSSMYTPAYETYPNRHEQRFNPIPSPSFVSNQDASFVTYSQRQHQHPPEPPVRQTPQHYQQPHSSLLLQQSPRFGISKGEEKHSSSASLANIMHSSSSAMPRMSGLEFY